MVSKNAKTTPAKSQPAMASSSTTSSPTRRFTDGEKVLCYEPDPTKVRVIYDAKILQVDLVPLSEAESEKGPERAKKEQAYQEQFLVHFQGWNASWDRFVPESFLLKDTAENRLIQKDLFHKADVFKKLAKKQKKWKKKLIMSEEDLQSASVDEEQKEEIKIPITPMNPPKKTAKKDDVFEQDLDVPIKFSDKVKAHLEADRDDIKQRKILPPIPANPNVISILEDYVRHYATARLLTYEKQRSKTYYTANRQGCKQYFENALDSISLAKEVAEGLRIMFDSYLPAILLYDEEKGHLVKSKKSATKKAPFEPQKKAVCDVEATSEVTFQGVGGGGSSKDSVHSSNSTSTVNLPSLLYPPGANPSTPESVQVMRQASEWKLIPEANISEDLPSFVYGGIHLLRLVTLIPEIISKMEMPQRNLKLIVKYMASVLEYLESHDDLFKKS